MRATLDSAGAVQATASYAPFGEPQGSSIVPFGFTGELQDQGLVNLRARWYDPSSGTFTAVDPFSGEPMQLASLHKYVYAENNPINAVDPTGLQTFRVWSAAFIGPETVEFVYQGGDWQVGVWKGDNRGFWDMKGPRPDSRIWAEVTIDTNADRGLRANSLKHGVGATVVHFLEDGRMQQEAGSLILRSAGG